jgi:hypothetical protein
MFEGCLNGCKRNDQINSINDYLEAVSELNTCITNADERTNILADVLIALSLECAGQLKTRILT